MFIRTERLFLRPAFPEDWREVLAGIGNEATVRNLARAPWPYREEDARGYCSRPLDAYAPSLLVTVPGVAGAPVVGGCGYGPRDDSGEIELGYWTAAEHRGKGYALEAARGVVELARMAGLDRIAAAHFEDNPASGSVLRKLGFTPTGEVRERFSAGRGALAPSIEFRLDLSESLARAA